MDLNENLITQHLETWTKAIETKSAAGRGSSNKLNLVGVQKLRELILEMAVRGLLVPQDSNEEPASVLLEKIAAEKVQLIKDKKIKKTKALPEISEEQKSFDLPRGWEWSANNEIFTLIKGKKPKELSETKREYPYLDIEALDRNNIRKYTNDDKAPRCSIGDLLVVCDGSRSGLILDGKNGVIGSTLARVDTQEALKPFIKLFFQKSYQDLNSALKGAAIPHLDVKALRSGYLALPPLKEQKRIVAKVDELMTLCDQLESQTLGSITTHQTLVETLLGNLVNPDNTANFEDAWALIAQNFDVLFTTEHSIDTLKQTILQLAVMGKLVPQNPNDEPASELLKKIAAEKSQLIADKKIKKSKPLPEITEDEKPFDLPNGWEWVRLSEIGEFNGGKTPSKSKSDYWGHGFYWVTPKDMKTELITSSQDQVTELSVKDGLKIFEPNSLLCVVRSGILRRAFPVALNKVKCAVNQDLKVLEIFDTSISEYILLMMKGFESYILENFTKTGTTVESIKFDEFKVHPFMIPPKEEQTRIVKKVNELMALCDQLKSQLQTAQQTRINLAQSIAQETLK